MLEIERKYKAKNTTFLNETKISFKINQGYLNSSPERTVRVRTKDNKGFLTIKGKSNLSGTTRFEWEKEIPFDEAIELLKLCEDFIIEKTRHIVIYGNKTFEIDVFEGKNKGLIIVEVELENENETIELPDWIEEEVTGDIKYYNSYISTNPFCNW
ncbi:CYTH domain-containing protein [Paenimyroides tangerinum]|uniref:CYTH domain-containing protein n=1 Tax=Paenimyroides tangerinum TaxID=2488728 RepID=A0A3P3WCZ4_9FLAO|nr:CYTH domain-containing protein [Paenimyroides tangerinum]RRJ92268.1 CYTH domain-containing protein [Paenimyroides tangerinum]